MKRKIGFQNTQNRSSANLITGNSSNYTVVASNQKLYNSQNQNLRNQISNGQCQAVSGQVVNNQNQNLQNDESNQNSISQNHAQNTARFLSQNQNQANQANFQNSGQNHTAQPQQQPLTHTISYDVNQFVHDQNLQAIQAISGIQNFSYMALPYGNYSGQISYGHNHGQVPSIENLQRGQMSGNYVGNGQEYVSNLQGQQNQNQNYMIIDAQGHTQGQNQSQDRNIGTQQIRISQQNPNPSPNPMSNTLPNFSLPHSQNSTQNMTSFPTQNLTIFRKQNNEMNEPDHDHDKENSITLGQNVGGGNGANIASEHAESQFETNLLGNGSGNHNQTQNEDMSNNGEGFN